MTNYVKIFFYKIGKFIDNHILCYHLCFSFFSRFFDFFSRFTNFIFFNKYVYFFFVYWIVWSIRLNIVGLHELLMGRMHFSELTLNFQIFIIVFYFIVYLVIVLTLLAFSEKISNYMKARYGPKIMSERHYNDSTSTLVTVVATIATAIFTATMAEAAENERLRVSAQEDTERQRIAAQEDTERQRIAAQEDTERQRIAADLAQKSCEKQVDAWKEISDASIAKGLTAPPFNGCGVPPKN
jgi:signal transduction histidine kinase